MTVSTVYQPLVYNGNGVTTSFAVTWPFFTGSLIVTSISSTGVETVKTSGTDYTVSGGTTKSGLPNTGTVVMKTAAIPAAGTQLRITRSTPVTQVTTWGENDAFPQAVVEAALDKNVMIAQELVQTAVDEISGDVLQLNSAGATDYWDAESHRIRNVTGGTLPGDVATKAQLDAAVLSAAGIVSSDNLVEGVTNLFLTTAERGAVAAAKLPTRSALASADVHEDVDFVSTAGFATLGDGGGALYTRALSEPAHAGKVQSADGAWWETDATRGIYASQFGFLPTASAAENAAALQAAVDFAGTIVATYVADKVDAVTTTVYLPAGLFDVQPGEVVVPSGVELAGQSMLATTLVATGTGAVIKCGSSARESAGLVVRDLTILGDATSLTAHNATAGLVGIDMERCVRLSGISRVMVWGCDTNIKVDGFGWHINDVYSLGAATYGLHIRNGTASQVRGGRIEYSGEQNIYVEPDAGGGVAAALVFDAVVIQNAQEQGLLAVTFDQISLRNCFIEGNNRSGALEAALEFDNSTGPIGSVTLAENVIVNTGGAAIGNVAILTTDVDNVIITNNWVRDTSTLVDYNYFYRQAGATKELVYFGNRVQLDSNAGPDYDIDQAGTIVRAFVLAENDYRTAGLRNLALNGGFDIWQNGTSFTSQTTQAADRWFLNLSGATGTLTREAFTIGQTDVPGNPKYYAKLVTTVADDNSGISTKLPDLGRFSGRTVTVSGWLYKGGGGVLTLLADQEFGTGGSPSSRVRQSAALPSLAAATWTKFSKTFRLASISGKTLGTNGDDHFAVTISNSANETEDVRYANIQIEYGPVSTPFETIGERGGYWAELERCKAYREVIAADDTTTEIATVFGETTTEARGTLHYTEKAKIPTITATGTFTTTPTGSVGTYASIAFARIGRKTAGIVVTVTAATVGAAGALRTTATTDKILIDTGL